MRRIVKRILSIILIIGVIAGNLSNSGVLEAEAALLDDNYEQKYGISYEDLFRLCPSYLDNEIFESMYLQRFADYASQALVVAQEKEETAEFFHNLKLGLSAPINTFLGKANISETEYEKYCKDVARKVLSDYYKTQNAELEVFNKVNSNLKNLKKTYDVVSEPAEFAQDLMDNYGYIGGLYTPTKLENTIKTISDSSVIKPYLSKGTDLFNIVTELLTLQEIEAQSVDLLLEALKVSPDSELKKGLQALQIEMDQDPTSYVMTHYVKDKIVGKIAQKLTEYGLETIIGGPLTALAFLAKDGIVLIYELTNPSYEDIQKSFIAYGFYSEMDTVVGKYKKKFKSGSYTSRDIILYEVAYSMMLSSLKLTTNIAKKCVNGKDSHSVWLQYKLDMASNSLTESFDYAAYIGLCMSKVKEDIDAGNLTIEEDSAKTPASGENYSSVESIKNKFAAIQNQYKPNTGVGWYDSWGGAIQCFGFARMVFYKLYGCDMPAHYDSYERYRYPNETNVNLIAQVAGGNVTKENVKAALSQGKLGDIIQASGSLYGQHTMIFVGADETGVTVYDCNSRPTLTEGSCLIHQWKLSWDLLVRNYGTGNSSIANGISLYRAANYAQIYGDGDGLFYDDSVNFVIENGVLTKYNGWQSYVVIPDTVTAIGDGAFKNNKNMLSVEIPDTVTSIGSSAFENCSNLLGVLIPNSVETIGSYAFNNCTSMNTVVLPQNEKFVEIKVSTFANCKALTKVEIPDSVTEIGGSSFSNNELITEVKLSKKLKVMGANAFYNCLSLTEIEIPSSLESAGDTVYYGGGWRESGAFAMCSNLKTVVFEENTTRVANHLFAYCNGIERIILPDCVTNIEAYAFQECISLKEIEMPDCVTQIGERAFYNDKMLTQLKLPKDLNSIDGQAFHNCTSITEIEIPKNLKVGGGYTFWGMRDFGAFDGCSNLKTVIFEEGMTEIPMLLFSDCNGIEEIVIPDTVTKIGSNAFSNCQNLTKVEIPDSVTEIGTEAFEYCTGLTSIIIPDSVTTIYTEAFNECSNIEEIRLSKCIDTIAERAFRNCKKLPEIEIPKSLVYGGKGMFAGCVNLKNVKFEEGITKIAWYLLSDCEGIEEVVIPDTVTYIGLYAFSNCENLKKVEIPDSVTEIGMEAFKYCTGLTSVIIPDSVTTMRYGVFNGCTSLQSAHLSNNITTLPDSTFMNCKKLTSVHFPSELTSIKSNAFYGCESLEEVVVPDKVTMIDSSVFEKCSVLTKVIIPDSVTSIGNGLFRDCISLKEVSLGTGLKTIPSNAFYGCTLLPSITIPENVETIGDSAFVNCTKLAEVAIPEKTTSIASNAFSYPKKMTIKGFEGSYAQEYAKEKGINFVKAETVLTSADNISVEGTPWQIPSGLTLNTKKLTETDEEFGKIDISDKIEDSNLSVADVKFTAYDIGFTDSQGELVKIDEELAVKVPTVAGYDAAKCNVYYVRDDGSLEDMHAKLVNGKLEFASYGLGTYLITETKLKTVSNTVYGDANSDGTVNSKDVVMLKKHLAGYKDLGINTDACDVNIDGEVNSKDAVLILKKLAGYDVELGK